MSDEHTPSRERTIIVINNKREIAEKNIAQEEVSFLLVGKNIFLTKELLQTTELSRKAQRRLWFGAELCRQESSRRTSYRSLIRLDAHFDGERSPHPSPIITFSFPALLLLPSRAI